MHNRFDQFVKDVLREGFDGLGMSQREVEVSADAQRMDFFFAPAMGSGPERDSPEGSRPAVPILFARMAATSCVVEHYHQPPNTDAVRGCLRKQLTWHHTRLKETGRGAGQGSPTEPEQAAAPLEIAVLWALSAGRPREVMTGFALRPLEGWPPGVYAGPLPAVPFRVVVLNELPEDRATLPLRLLARGETFNRAMRELRALPEDEWECQRVLPYLVKFRLEVEAAGTNVVLNEEEKEMLVTAQEMIQDLKQRAMADGIQQTLLHQFARKLGRALSQEESALICARLDTLGSDRLGDVVLDLPPAALGDWLADPAAR